MKTSLPIIVAACCLAVAAACNVAEGEARRNLPIIFLKESSGELDECKRELQRFMKQYEKTSQFEVAYKELKFIEEWEQKSLEGKEEAIKEVISFIQEQNTEISEAIHRKELKEADKKSKTIIPIVGLEARMDEEIEALWLTAKKVHLSYRAYYRMNSHYIQNPIHLGLKYDKERYKINTIPFKRGEDGYQAYNAEVSDRLTGAYIAIDYEGYAKLILDKKSYIKYLTEPSR